MKTSLLLLLIPLATLPLAQAEVNLSLEIRLGKVLPPPPPEIIVIEQASPPGPPPWAPARGFRRIHEYYYYPGADVYFRPVDRVWFYLDGRAWRSGPSLPTSIQVNFSRSVPLTMGSDLPHQFHEQIRTRYPADYFVTQVKVKDDKSDKSDNGKPEHAADDSPGRSKGKGKGKNK